MWCHNTNNIMTPACLIKIISITVSSLQKLYQEKNMTTSEEKVLQTIEPYQEKNKTSDETVWPLYPLMIYQIRKRT